MFMKHRDINLDGFHCQMIELYRMLRFIIILYHDRQPTAINSHEPVQLGKTLNLFLIVLWIPP